MQKSGSANLMELTRRCFIYILKKRNIASIIGMVIYTLICLNYSVTTLFNFLSPLKKYEWQRKLLGQNFKKFWYYRTNIYFSQDENRHRLSQLRLSLFSKKQTDKILVMLLTQAWNLDSNIKQPD